MKSYRVLSTISYQLSTLFALASIALSQMAQAVSPPPDGGYPNGNTAEGQNALFSLTTGGFNTALGWSSLRDITGGGFNTAVGAGTLVFNTANSNTGTGTGALLFSTNGRENTANGAFSLVNNTSGQFNTAMGFEALFANTVGQANTAVGEFALFNSIDGNLNTALGLNAGFNVTSASNVICIGANVAGEDVSNSCYIGNIAGTELDRNNATPVYIDVTTGQLGTVLVDAPGDKTTGSVPRLGQGQALLNEFLKEHRNVEEQGVTIAQLKKEVASLAATVKDQAAQIQKVSAQIGAQIEVATPATKVVLNQP